MTGVPGEENLIVANSDEEDSDDIDDLTELFLLAISEFLSTAILIILSMGGEMSIGYGDRFGIAFVNGLAEMACIYGFTELKADFNPAVTLTFWITGDCDLIHAVVKVVSQIAGAITGCLLLSALFTEENDATKHFAALKIGSTCSYSAAWWAEIVLTYIVIFIIFQTADTNSEPGEALAATLSSPLAVGFTVISCVGVAFPLTGASLNPARAISTAVVGSARHHHLFKNMEVFFLGPMVAGAIVGLQEKYFMEHLRKLYAKVDGHSSAAWGRTSKSKKQAAEKKARSGTELIPPGWLKDIENSIKETVEHSINDLREDSRDGSHSGEIQGSSV